MAWTKKSYVEKTTVLVKSLLDNIELGIEESYPKPVFVYCEAALKGFSKIITNAQGSIIDVPTGAFGTNGGKARPSLTLTYGPFKTAEAKAIICNANCWGKSGAAVSADIHVSEVGATTNEAGGVHGEVTPPGTGETQIVLSGGTFAGTDLSIEGGNVITAGGGGFYVVKAIFSLPLR